MGDQLLVITIQLGTKWCRLAQQLRCDFQNNTQVVTFFKAGTLQRVNFPSALILSREGRAEEFGYRAIERFEIMNSCTDNCIFFENVIESLYMSEVCWVS